MDKKMCRYCCSARPYAFFAVALLALATMLVASLLCSCSNENIPFKKGEQAYAIGEYYEAAKLYRQSYTRVKPKEKAKRADRAFRMADCYERINNPQKAVQAYQNAVRYNHPDSTALLRLARQQLKTGNYKLARENFTAYLKKDPENVLALNGLESCDLAPQWKAEPNLYQVKKSALFSSTRRDFSPMLVGDDADQIAFTSTRKQAMGDDLSNVTGDKYADMFVARKDENKKWKQPEAIEGDVNTVYDEGVSCLSPDGKTMYFTRCSSDPSYPRYAEIWQSTRTDASWGKPTKCMISRDTLSSYAHPAVSPDGEWLYFVSDIEGGEGGFDIWRTRIMKDGFGGMENLGKPINTPGNEMFPVFRPNGEFYFSSDGHPGMGGLDIFKYRQPQNQTLTPPQPSPAGEGVGLLVGNAETSTKNPDETLTKKLAETFAKNPDETSTKKLAETFAKNLAEMSAKNPKASTSIRNSSTNTQTAPATNENTPSPRGEGRGEVWGEVLGSVLNLGYPMNSPMDDFGMTFEGVYNRGFFSTSRGDVNRGWENIYSFECPEVVMTVTGWVYEKDGYELPEGLVYVVADDGTNEKISPRSDGSFTMVITPGVQYVMLGTCKGYLNVKHEICMEQAKESVDSVLQFALPPINVPVLIENIFYEFDKATLTDASTEALDRLVVMMEENPNITIELSAHCDYKGNNDYNQRLSQRRAESVVRYLIDHGVKADRLTAVGYGEDRPKVVRKRQAEAYKFLNEGDVLTEDFIMNLKDDEQEICNGLNRRTEFRVLRTTYGTTLQEYAGGEKAEE